jgi:hypothetical protein
MNDETGASLELMFSEAENRGIDTTALLRVTTVHGANGWWIDTAQKQLFGQVRAHPRGEGFPVPPRDPR